MALIKCSHCQASISDKAVVCPRCGHETNFTKTEVAAQPSTKKYYKRWAIVLAVVTTALCVHILLYCIGAYDNGNVIKSHADGVIFTLSITVVLNLILTFTKRWRKTFIGLFSFFLFAAIVNWGGTLNPHNTPEYLDAVKREREARENEMQQQEEIQSAVEVSPFVGEYDIEDCWTMGAITWRLVVKEDETCTLRYVESDKIAYGSWKRIGDCYRLIFDDFQPVVHFPNDNPVNPKGLHYSYIDEGIEWIYQDSHAFDAKNPNKRLPIKRIK